MEEYSVKISVVLAVYNGENYLKEAVDSILAQTFKEFELVIVNDGSTDHTENIIKNYRDSRIVYLENEGNKGLVYSLNKGISRSRGKYIARMDSDDIALSRRLQVQYDYMEAHQEVGICGSNVEAFFSGGGKSFILRFPQTDRSIRNFAFFQSPFSHPSVMIRKEILVNNHLVYPNEFPDVEDYALWIDLLKYTKASNFSSVLMRYRIHPESVTAKSSKNEKYVYNATLIQNKYFRQKGITIPLEDIALYSRFVNRDREYSLDKESQRAIGGILENFLSQLFEHQKDAYPGVTDYISSVCFFRFFKKRKYPQTSYLRKLFWRGVYSFIKKLPVYLYRFITRS